MALSPMMSQYLETKKQYSDCILFYRLGDFYELFFDDAITGSKELDIALTGKDCGLDERAPMCGVPFHAVDSYLNKLIEKGYKVAIAEQVEDPKLAKGIVKREVIKVITPGTNTNPFSLSEDKNNYLMCVFYSGDNYALTYVDITTGDFKATQVDTASELMDEINRLNIAEIISNNFFMMSPIDLGYIKNKLNISFNALNDSYFEKSSCTEIIKKHFNVLDLSGLGLNDYPMAVVAIGATLQYLYETQKNDLKFINKISTYSIGKFMTIDSATRRNLELVETMREKNKKGSLLWVLDKTKTAMGARRIRCFIEQPLIDKNEIVKRQSAIDELNSRLIDRDEIREYLNPIYDFERILARISYKSANPRDLISFKNSVKMLPHIKYILKDFNSGFLKEIYDNLDCLEDLYDIIENSINEDAPVSIKDGGIIKNGFDESIDKYRKAKIEGKQWLSEIEEKERELTGIKSLKIKYSKVFGYCIEITNTFKDKVPDRYVRRQTLVNAERYITEELKQLEDTILGSEEKLFSAEYNIFCEIRDKVADCVVRIQNSAYYVSLIDAICSLSYVAEQNNYVRPHINTDGIIKIKNGRHPVVEKVMDEGLFIPNDTYADQNENRVSIITGPNMAGKSTYMRQLALLVLMAGIGSFVPASEADICICDRIFTRVGASDDLASGQSTFMVEMTEVANILRNATSNSLVILDEIGRGTSTYDGLSIAWAVVEYIADKNKCGAKTLFSTHYHELTELEGKIDGVKNYCISVKENGKNITFLRKIIRGGADKSYGILVASLAGVPEAITARAEEIVEQLVSSDITADAKKIDFDAEKNSVKHIEENDYLRDFINGIEIDKITPLEAINLLSQIKDM